MEPDARRRAARFVVLIGVVSLFADATYEAARSVTGPFLALLGASGAVVGILAGFGELVGYGLRLASGYLGDRTRRYWPITLFGYAVNTLSVPLLALAGRWETAALLIVGERLGKAIRTPPRDVLLSHAAAVTGRGWAFGLHEALDQAGAVAGPLLVAAALYAGSGYRVAFAILLVPALLALAVLLATRWLYPQPADFEETAPTPPGAKFPRVFWIYIASVACLAAGYADFPLIAFHVKKLALASDTSIPLLYALAMGIDAVAALVLGRYFDARGLPMLIVVPFLSIAFAPLAFSASLPLICVGVALWGVGMGAQESIVRAAIAAMIPADRRGTAYGTLNAVYGLAWFAGSAAMGVLYDLSIGWLVVFSVVSQGLAIPILHAVRSQALAERRSAVATP
jgi:MFS family permease